MKHCQEETAGSSELVQGVLLGLVVESGQDKVLEITNCFPFPRHNDDDPDFDEGEWESPHLMSLISEVSSCSINVMDHESVIVCIMFL